MFFRFADNGNANSAASHFRRNRVRRFAELFGRTGEEFRVLDVGGTGQFWRMHRDELPALISITILNRTFDDQPVLSWVRYVVGDARRMHMFADTDFDVCFSNSVIEHAGTPEDQTDMAQEIRRVARGYFVQTPNAHFPLEPHFLLPGWQYAPISLRASLLQRRDVGWMKRVSDPVLARATVESIRLLSERRLRRLFPDGQIYKERIGPLVKSLIAWRPVRGGQQRSSEIHLPPERL
jgi:hypothetical protein